MLKVVFDTVVFVRSLINPQSNFGKVVFQYSSAYRLSVSKPVVIEILEVLKRPEVMILFHTLENLDRKKVIEIISQAEVVDVSSIPRISRDIKDDKFLATAKAANADYLVSEDKDLLTLKEYKRTKIVDTKTFLATLDRDMLK